MTYHHPDQWIARAANQATSGGPSASPFHRAAYAVDPHTCEPLDPEALEAHLAAEHDDEYSWARVTFVLFSMLVSSSIFASFNATTFYTGVVLILGA